MIARTKASYESAREGAPALTAPAMIAYGVSQEEAARFGLPCGGTLRLIQEPLLDTHWIVELLARTAPHQLVARSRRNQCSRKKRLAEHFGLSDVELARLHGPVGRALGSKTPAEIAVSIVAEIIQIKNSVSIVMSRRVGGVSK